jgi:hypothetical protein
MNDELDDEGLEKFAVAIVDRLDLHTSMLEDIREACCEDPDENSPSPLIEELREMRASIDRQTRALDGLTAELRRRPG